MRSEFDRSMNTMPVNGKIFKILGKNFDKYLQQHVCQKVKASKNICLKSAICIIRLTIMCPYAVKSLPAGDFKWYHKNSLIDIRIYEYTFNLNFQFQCLNLQN